MKLVLSYVMERGRTENHSILSNGLNGSTFSPSPLTKSRSAKLQTIGPAAYAENWTTQ